MSWPPQSAQLNITELLWDLLDREWNNILKEARRTVPED